MDRLDDDSTQRWSTARLRRPQPATRVRETPRGASGADEPPRRLMAAGHVIVVGLICLGAGSLLNAQGIQKTAHGQPLGWRRTVAIRVADPLADLSHLLHTDRPRAWLQDRLGRGGDDDINTSLPSPTTLPAGATTSSIKRSFTLDDRMRVWVGGDSLSITPGESVINKFPGNSGGVIEMVVGQVDGHVSTGLARPEVFNWPQHLAEETARVDPDVVVLTIGSNDDQSLTGEGGVGPFGSPEWQTEYRRRVGGLMDQVLSEGRSLVWVGIPIIRNTERSETRYKLMNDIYESEAEKREGRVYYVDTYSLFTDDKGRYADYLPNSSGQLTKYRADDGIHFTRAGGDVIADAIFAVVEKNFDLTARRDEGGATTTAP